MVQNKTMLNIVEFAIECGLDDHLENLFFFVNDRRPNETERKVLWMTYNELNEENESSYGTEGSSYN
jgi:hypothetical protein